MIVMKMDDMYGGWFVGNFQPSAHQTSICEVGYKYHKQGEKWDKHFHARAREINYLIRGKMLIQGETIHGGSIFILEKNEIADPIFLEDCEVIVVKIPSVLNDKHIIQ